MLHVSFRQVRFFDYLCTTINICDNYLKKEKQTSDEIIFTQFKENQELRELRLLALECLSKIIVKEEKNKFISEYFNCSQSEEIVNTIVTYFPDGEKNDVIKKIMEHLGF